MAINGTCCSLVCLCVVKFCKVSGCKIKEYCEAHDIQMYVIKNTVLSMSGIKNIAFKF